MLHLQKGRRAAPLSEKENDETSVSQGWRRKICLSPAGGARGACGAGEEEDRGWSGRSWSRKQQDLDSWHLGGCFCVGPGRAEF